MTTTTTHKSPARSDSAQSEFVSFRSEAPNIPSTSYATFGLYRYPAKFVPQVVWGALSRYALAGDSVLDPFAGYGTVGTVARTQGNLYEMWDLGLWLSWGAFFVAETCRVGRAVVSGPA